MEILDCKGVINEKINAILNEYQQLEQKHSQENKLFSEEVERLNQLNLRFSHELFEKDKLLTCKDKTIYDYENMIKELQINKKEEGKFDMIRGQDKEIKNLQDKLSKRDNEIVRLAGKISLLEGKIDSSTVEMKVEEVEEVEEKVEEPLNVEEKVEEPLNVEEKVEEPLNVEDKVDDKVDDKVEDNESMDEEPLNVEVITLYKKSYYVIENESPQYIYNIDDDEGLGDKVGLIEKGKKVFYKNK